MRAVSIVTLAVLLGVGCKKDHAAENRAAKERFLKGEVGKAPGLEAGSAAGDVAIDVTKAATDPAEMERAHLMDAVTAARLLGSFRYTGKADYAATKGRGKQKLGETLEWAQARNGDFSTRVENSRGHGLETWWTGKKLYLRRRYGRVRERPVEGREHLKYPSDVFASWSAVYKIFRGRLRFTRAGSATVGGRTAVRFEVSLSPTPLTKLAESLPPHPEKVDLGDLKVTTAVRHAWRAAGRPVAATGSVELDAETGVVLGVDVSGRLALPSKAEGAELTVSLVARLREVGGEVAVRAPEGATPEPPMRKVESRRFDLIDMVRIEDFLIDKWEFPNQRGATPKVGVTLQQARSACQAVGKRLCQLKEWQKACHADRPRNRYPYGRIYSGERCNTEGGAVKAAGERKECRGELEVYDLVGNAGEWVEAKNRKTETREWCVAGGGPDDKEKARCLRCVPRDDVEDVSKVGFRCCK